MIDINPEFALISTCFAFGFFFESIFGFGGGLIAYSILGFFIDLKLAIKFGLYISSLSSLHILLISWRNLNSKVFLKLLPVAIIGSAIGSSVFSHLSLQNLSLFFGILLTSLSLKSLFFEKVKLPKIIRQKLLIIGSINQGAFGVGGPFVVLAIKEDFANKAQLRATMAGYFLFCNLIRFTQLSISQEIDLSFFAQTWWTIFPVFCTIWLGHKVHLKANETHFRYGIAALTLIAGLRFLFYEPV